MSSYLFSGKIHCLDCGQKFRGKKFRNRKGYVCSGNSNYGNDYCRRFTIYEEEIINLINSHFNGEEWSIDHVSVVEVKFGQVVVRYLNGSKSILTKDKYII